MLNRFNEELHRSLIDYQISGDTNIFVDYLMQRAGVQVTGKKKEYGFKSYYYNDEPKHHLDFTLPTVSLADLHKVLAVLKVSANDYQINKPVKVTEKVLFKDLLPEFRQHLAALSQTNPGALRPYIIESKPKLESIAVEVIQHASNDLLKVINNPDSKQYVDDYWLEFSALLFEMKGILDRLHSDSHYYHFVLKMLPKLNSFLHSHPQIVKDKDLETYLGLLREALATYGKYNRAESALATMRVFKDLKDFFKSYKISTEACDVVERTLLHLAGVTKKPGKCNFDRGYDQARMVFTIRDIDKKDAKKFVAFFQGLGDETAKEGSGHGEGAVLQCASMSGPSREKVVETHHFEIDGLVMLEKAVPALKKQIEEWAKSDKKQLAEYEKETREYFSKQDPKVAEQAAEATASANVSKASRILKLFKPASPPSAQPAQAVVSEEASEKEHHKHRHHKRKRD